jgi:hypothetical protein
LERGCCHLVAGRLGRFVNIKSSLKDRNNDSGPTGLNDTMHKVLSSMGSAVAAAVRK